jgi:hypothetical protein
MLLRKVRVHRGLWSNLLLWRNGRRNASISSCSVPYPSPILTESVTFFLQIPLKLFHIKYFENPRHESRVVAGVEANGWGYPIRRSSRNRQKWSSIEF